jgi:hypothetical protein
MLSLKCPKYDKLNPQQIFPLKFTENRQSPRCHIPKTNPQ